MFSENHTDEEKSQVVQLGGMLRNKNHQIHLKCYYKEKLLLLSFEWQFGSRVKMSLIGLVNNEDLNKKGLPH